LALVPGAKLNRRVYNITAFSPSAAEISAIVAAAFPGARLSTAVDPKRQAIVDSWPQEVDDSAARRDWGHDPHYDLEKAFRDYLIPTIRQLYA
jgi:nucleoside-diphosphate-sugar epimerase